MTIDTIHEFFGYNAEQSLAGTLWSLGIFAIAAVAGILWTFHKAAQKGDGRIAWNYLLQLAILAACYVPVTVKVGPRTLRPPKSNAPERRSTNENSLRMPISDVTHRRHLRGGCHVYHRHFALRTCAPSEALHRGGTLLREDC